MSEKPLDEETETAIEAATMPLAMGVEQYYGNFPDAMEGSAELVEECLRKFARRVQAIERERAAKVAETACIGVRSGRIQAPDPMACPKCAVCADAARAIRSTGESA